MTTTSDYKPTAEDVKRLRDATGAGMLDCRAALVNAGGDYEAAQKHLLETGMSKAAKKADRTTKEGLIESYIHVGGKIGALVELNCETDFVAKNERFKELARDIAMHVAAMPVKYVSRQAVPENELNEAKAELAKSLPEGKPANVIEKIVEGKLNKWYEEHVLLDMPFIKNDEQTVGELIGSVVGVLGENIQVRRFSKFALGES
ncbi:MAG: translation elongation factor Ts [Candidatus Eremiobacteraeota bacterium]|nr:translation elongation factor Ts [Candidatus Eremiobacteraeota bacterium]